MTEKMTPYGRLIVGKKEELFAQAVHLAADQAKRTADLRFSWAFTGGSTPSDWYKWCVSTKALPSELLGRADFTVSDERYVPLSSDQSNFGNAERQLLEPLKVDISHRIPWPVAMAPVDAAAEYSGMWAARFGVDRAYDICFLGMGDDAHTASVFPGSILLREPVKTLFTAVEVPGKGWRLTITPAGLKTCGLIVVMTLGAGKAEALARVMNGPFDPLSTPSQLLKESAAKVVWLVDEAAASKL
ncbi:MAG TPA: 6-phosphogluconolactonase [Opitutaceae bacterium]|nr:6-phosphogluconolactonase [Opitutaceae bacterium]